VFYSVFLSVSFYWCKQTGQISTYISAVIAHLGQIIAMIMFSVHFPDGSCRGLLEDNAQEIWGIVLVHIIVGLIILGILLIGAMVFLCNMMCMKPRRYSNVASIESQGVN